MAGFHIGRACILVIAAVPNLFVPSCGPQVEWHSDVDPYGEQTLQEPDAGPPQSSSVGERLPDPRYRPPMGIEELDRVASMVSRASGGGFKGSIGIGPDPGPTCRIRGPRDGGEMQVHPVAQTRVPPNSWAFIFGHEFAHQSGRFGAHGSTTPELELRADIEGADYAREAGFDLSAHLGWIFSRPNKGSASHGLDHDRAEAVARHFGIHPDEIGMHVQRYRQAGL
jgi:hypothetical protein